MRCNCSGGGGDGKIPRVTNSCPAGTRPMKNIKICVFRRVTARLQQVTVSLRRKTAKRKVETSNERKKIQSQKARKVREEKHGAKLKTSDKKGAWECWWTIRP